MIYYFHTETATKVVIYVKNERVLVNTSLYYKRCDKSHRVTLLKWSRGCVGSVSYLFEKGKNHLSARQSEIERSSDRVRRVNRKTCIYT